MILQPQIFPGEHASPVGSGVTHHIQTKFHGKRYQHSPQFCHSIQKLLFGELALSGCTKLPCHDQHRDAGRIQREVITKLLDPIYTNLILILRIYQLKKTH